MMKINVLAFLLVAFSCFGQENFVVVTAKTKEAKIFFSGGMIKKTFSADVLSGKNYIIIKEFGRNSGVETSAFMPDKKINVLRVESYNDNSYLYADKLGKNSETDQLIDSIDYYRKVHKNFEQELALVRNSIGIIQKNQTLGDPNSTEILKMIDFNKSQLKELYKEEGVLNYKISTYQNKVSLLENRRNMSSRSQGNANIVILHISSERKQKVNFEVSQYLHDASWRPHYIIKSNGIQSPLKISYKAKIRQNTGLEFRDFPVKLVNGSFSADEKPYELDRWFLRTERDMHVSNQAFRSAYEKSNSSVQMMMVADKSSRVTQKAMKTEISLNKSAVIPSDVEVTEDVDEFEVTTNYKYFTTPKLENKTYLLAYIKDYSKYNLLPGSADIIVEDTQIGSVSIDTNQLSSEMLISLGSDSNILTKRELVKKEKKSLGDKVKQEVYQYEITVKNNKNIAVNLELKDQIPLSTDEKIKIEALNPDKASYEPSTGFLIWNIDVKPNETKKINFGFNVTLPEDLITIDIK